MKLRVFSEIDENKDDVFLRLESVCCGKEVAVVAYDRFNNVIGAVACFDKDGTLSLFKLDKNPGCILEENKKIVVNK